MADQNHGQAATPMSSTDIPASSSSDTFSRWEDDGSKETFGCQQCSKVFNRRENLSRHLRTHDPSPSHCCSKCGKGFTRSDLLRRHEAGHERWDSQESKRGRQVSVKRKKVDVQDLGTSDSPVNSSWTNSSQSPSSGLSRPYGSAYGDVRDPFTIEQAMGNGFSSPSFPIPDAMHETHSSISGAHQRSQFDPAQAQHDMFPHMNLPLRSNHTSENYSSDFSSFLLPPNPSQFSQDWFSNDFYSAMRETGNEWGSFNEIPDPNTLAASHRYPGTRAVNTGQYDLPDLTLQQDEDNSQGSITRISSPPNEASRQDSWPFQWNPNSGQILKAQAIHMPDDHPLFQNHYSRFDITEATLLRVKYFLQPPAGREFHQSEKGSFVLPPLRIINVFIRLFFENFSPHMPILHHPTVNTTTDLPPPLLAAIVIIGAIYSHVQHTRRFSIVLVDIIRWHLCIAIECDNSLMRDPMIIYAEVLICHTGLWGGNKRAFELAEVVRGSLVTFIRRLNFGELLRTPEQDFGGDPQAEWKEWIAEETRRRLAWVVYGIDSYFPSVMNLPPTISVGEVRNLLCPCDEKFWTATSARNWKNLLGLATAPPSKSFSAAVGPFILLLPSGQQSHSRLPAISLNPWSAFLVLQSMTHQIFQFSLESMVARPFMDNDPYEDDSIYQPEESNNFLRKLHAERHAQLASSLNAWARAYLSRPYMHMNPSSRHFHACSVVIHHLSTILLDIPLSDLQNAIGKDGSGGIVQAITNLRNWAQRSPHIAHQVAYNATKTIVSLAPSAPSNTLGDNGGRNVDASPYSLIAIFLCHIVLWAYATVTTREQKVRLLENVLQHPVLRVSAFVALLKRALGLDGRGEDGEPKLLFRSAAEMLTRHGTWGGSLNLALLLHRRAEM